MGAPEHDGVAALAAIVPPRWEVVPQKGQGLGARLGHAFEALGGHDTTVALVSADSPTAPWSALRAVEGLRDADVAMGPCDDGGYWLIATTRLELGILEGIPWSTDSVASQTRARCKALGLGLIEIGSAHDVDEAQDLERLREELREHPQRAPRTAAVLVEVR
jgi:glycosyltransferase A (GT-A) superfamily protein (DUF2064 family)